ncbi:RNA-guided endonuclease InsQ/TnpB family protein [Haladaptatus halobius]|uniref:RNA-guided endonuclease InsQ/TnpB family protein n=1 Tax=Haladaptatus halobius TaxID=2884875 RepID=UPI001D0BA1CD|nr:transposase [Haladaptatus halobius]
MRYNYRYRLNPSDAHRETLDYHRDLYRQVYNHFLHRLNRVDGTTKYGEINQLPSMKQWWDDLTNLYSRTLQNEVERLYTNLSRLKDAKDAGRKVGLLKWKAPAEYRSFAYRQSGFELKNTSGQPVLQLSKIGEIPVRMHRDIPDGAKLKQVTVKKVPTGEWFAVFGIETPDDPPEKPDELTDVVGIDVGILKYAHDTDGTAVESLDLSVECERLERAQRDLSRKQHGSENYRTQQRVVARRHAELKQKRQDFLHKLSNYYANEYDLVAVEDLNIAGRMQFDSNSRNRAAAAWGTFLRMLEYKCERQGTHFVAVDPRNSTKECASCGVKTNKPLWVREHSCPSCGFEADRDANAAWNILARGLDQIGTGCPESTPAETALPTDTVVSAKGVIETGSPAL